MDSTAPKPFVFVLMPFADDFKDIYELGIKQASKNAGAYADRVDQQIHFEDILQRVYNQIAKADIIVADMTGKNPNVFYETGYAHALGKTVILLTQNMEDIPFDLNHFPFIVYEKKIADKLLPELEKKIRWAIANTRKSASEIIQNIQYIMFNTLLENNPLIEVRIDKLHGYGKRYSYRSNLILKVYNNPEKIIKARTFEISLATFKNVTLNWCEVKNTRIEIQRIDSPNKKETNQLQHLINLLPGTSEFMTFHLIFRAGDFNNELEAVNSFPHTYQLNLLEHSDNDFREIPFLIKSNFTLKPDHSNLVLHEDNN